MERNSPIGISNWYKMLSPLKFIKKVHNRICRKLLVKKNLERIYLAFLYLNYGAWYAYKPLFGSSVATCRLACSEISLSIIGKKLKRSPGKA